MRLLYLSIFYLISIDSVLAKIEPPNYNFSVDKFQDFMPDKKISQINIKYPGKKEVIFKQGPYTTYKYYIEHVRYKFAVLVQTINGTVTDFHARLPQYFLHDIFHQSLINRFGKQDFYKKTEESAIYVWKNKDNIKHVYSGTCTITCFPIFYAVKKVEHKYGNSYKSLLEKFNETSVISDK
jgi:hypothetical protein